jgi:C4-dicarboxylate-specific signal transduction histidine kinase
MRDVVLRSAETLSPQLRAAMAVEVDRGVKEVGNVLSSRAALDQVVSNLLVNAAESMIEGGVQGGRLLVSAVREEVDGAPMSHFYFKDNGKGIPEEHLKRVFERRFSTKGRGSGLGLHWSANTVTALKGLLYAGMEASSGGACLHLLLPLVVEKNGQSGMEADKSHE